MVFASSLFPLLFRILLSVLVQSLLPVDLLVESSSYYHLFRSYFVLFLFKCLETFWECLYYWCVAVICMNVKIILLLFLLASCSPPDPDAGLSMGQIAERQIIETRSNCSVHVDDYNSTLCFANYLMNFRKSALESDRSYPDYMIDTFCSAAKVRDLCFFYVAATIKKSELCKHVVADKRIECRMLSDDYVCYSFKNKFDCMVNKAIFMEFVDHSKSVEIRRYLAEQNQSVEKLEENCEALSAHLKDDNLSYEERFLKAYLLLRYYDIDVDFINASQLV